MAASLQTLIDEREIVNVCLNYAQALDRSTGTARRRPAIYRHSTCVTVSPTVAISSLPDGTAIISSGVPRAGESRAENLRSGGLRVIRL